jgi:hypothetical protein
MRLFRTAFQEPDCNFVPSRHGIAANASGRDPTTGPDADSIPGSILFSDKVFFETPDQGDSNWDRCKTMQKLLQKKVRMTRVQPNLRQQMQNIQNGQLGPEVGRD